MSINFMIIIYNKIIIKYNQLSSSSSLSSLLGFYPSNLEVSSWVIETGSGFLTN
jgi:hypothetical protein